MKPSSKWERAILVGVEWESGRHLILPDLDELGALAESAGARVVDHVIQRRDKPDPATFVGQGKVQEIAAIFREKSADLVIFDDQLTPAQQRNLAEQIEGKVLDRTALILDIFASRARTNEAKIQVEVAQLQYMLPRLGGEVKAISRAGGGIGTRGPGETQLETDRRRIRHRLAVLAEELREIRRGRDLQRRPRKRAGRPTIALVGYTNAGKSTLFNLLTGAEVERGNLLFCTLDPTIRLLTLPNHQEVFLTDTVGFIRKLPHDLVEAFKSTLEETAQADLLLHILDGSHPQAEEQYDAVLKVLQELNVTDKPMITVINKVDQITNEFTVARLLTKNTSGLAISAATGEGVERLLEAIMDALAAQIRREAFLIPFTQSRALAIIHEKGKVLQEEYRPEGIYVEAEIDAIWAGRVQQIIEPSH
ncbi:MAG TPA: GTPase HflX [Bacillota bacterium]|nr:GTPase HflX [Bacillota bacterium]